MNTPPKTGPRALASPHTPPIIPKYLPRSLQVHISSAVQTLEVLKRKCLPLAEQVTDTDIGQDDQASASHALDNSSCKQHSYVYTESCDQGTKEENGIRQEQDGLATPNITEFAPGGNGSCRCEKKGGADPGVVCFGEGKDFGNGWDSGGNDGLSTC